jgi:hypothetical protein
MRHRQSFTFGLAVVAAFALSISAADAQTTAVGPYYATPAWDQTLPPTARFIVLANMQSQAVLDRETGLVWQRNPGTTSLQQSDAFMACWQATTGGKQGWRIPTAAELMTLGDATNNRPFQIRLAPGHPFVLGGGFPRYWASDRLDRIFVGGTFKDNYEVFVYFGDTVDPNGPGWFGGAIIIGSASGPGDSSPTWCVRGGVGGSAR